MLLFLSAVSIIIVCINELICFSATKTLTHNTQRMFPLGFSPTIIGDWCTFTHQQTEKNNQPFINLKTLTIVQSQKSYFESKCRGILLRFPPCLLKPIYVKMVRTAILEQEKMNVALNN